MISTHDFHEAGERLSVDDVKLKVAFENGSKNNKKGVKCPESVTPQLPHIYNFFLGNVPQTVWCICQLQALSLDNLLRGGEEGALTILQSFWHIFHY